MDAVEYFRFLAALCFIVALLVGFAWLVRRSGLIPKGLLMTPPAGERRLAVTEVLPLDTKRRLVLVRRDDVEHLLLIGMQGETVVETGIRREDSESEAPGEDTGNGKKDGA